MNRLSIQFKDEDGEKFEERLNLSKDRQKNADQSIKLLKFIEKVDNSIVSEFPKTIGDDLKSKFHSSPTYQSLMEEIKGIHLNHEKKFLLHDPQNTMGVPDPVP